MSRTEVVIILWGLTLLFLLCERNVCSGFRVHSTISKTEATALVDLFVAARQSVDQPSMAVGLGHCLAPIHDVSYDSPFVALELTTLKPQLTRDADQSIFKITDCASQGVRVVSVFWLDLLSFFCGERQSLSTSCPTPRFSFFLAVSTVWVFRHQLH